MRIDMRGLNADVYWSEPDGYVSRMSPGDGLYYMACIHPSGTHAVCWGGAVGRPRLWFGDGSGAFDAITDGRFSARYPAFNAKGNVLVYCKSYHRSETIERLRNKRTTLPVPAASMSIVVRAADGSWERELTDGRFQDQRPALSPDGSQVVFVSNRTGTYELWTMDMTQAEPVPLLRGMRAYRPWWSIDQQHIFFCAFGHRHQLYMIPATGGEPMPVKSDDQGDTHGPFADPNGRTLIAHSTRGAIARSARRRWEIYEFPLDGSAPRWLSPGAHGTRARNGIMTYDLRHSR